MTQPLRTQVGTRASMSSRPRSWRVTAFALAAAMVALATILVPAQTQFKLDRNKYTLEEDVKVGREAAAEVSKELPLLNDARTEAGMDPIAG